MKAILVIVLICLFRCADASNYYFSTISGNDSRTPEQAQDPTTPWKTLNKLNSFFSSLKPGDSVLLKSDEIFYGSIVINKSGLPGSPIVISEYGTGNKPVVTSLVTLSNWISKGKGIWESYNPSLGPTINMVLLNGAEQAMGRYPNVDAGNNGYMNFESHFSNTSITDNELNTSLNWKGAELVTRPRHWILNRSLITSQSGKKISYSTKSLYEPYDNYGYFIQNSIKTLDEIGEWYYDPLTNKMSVYFGSNSPSSYIMQAATATGDLVLSTRFSNITFDNIALKGSNSSGFNIVSGSNVKIKNCDILFSGVTGVLVQGHKNLDIENCTISNSNNNGIDLAYGVNNTVIKNNKILNTALNAGMMQNGEGNGLAIYTNGDGNTIDSNEIHNTGFIGITFYGSNTTIKNNFIDSFCFVKDDGGGIYSHGGATAPVNRKIIGNIVTNGIGAGPGTDHFDKRSVTGIYMDADIMNVEITGNTVTTAYQGIFIQSSAGMVIKNNTVFDNARQMTIIERPGDNPVRNSVITQNIFCSKTADENVLFIMSGGDDIGQFGTFDSNYYARPIDDRIDIYNSRVTSAGAIVENFDLAGWKKKYSKDASSKASVKQIQPYKLNHLTGLNKFTGGGDFSNDIDGILPSSCTVALNTSGVLDGGCLQVVPSATSSEVYMQVGAVTAGKTYVLSYSLKGSGNNTMSIAAGLKQTASPYSALTPLQSRKITANRTENEMVFVPATSAGAANLMFKVDGQSTYYLDNVKFYEADVTLTDIDDSLKFFYNETSIPKSISLTGKYTDLKGRIYAGTIALEPYTSIILIQTNRNAKSIPPTVKITNPLNDTTINASTELDINAIADEPGGAITEVDFYNGKVLLGSVNSSPYSFAWKNIPEGSYTITAVATADNGAVATSSPIVVSAVKLQGPPIVNITSPEVSATVYAPGTVLIEATAVAANPDASITKVEFYNGSTLLTTERKLPYSWYWLNVPPGNDTIFAKAYDSKGLTSTSAGVPVTVASLSSKSRSSRSSSAQSSVASPAAGHADVADNVNNLALSNRVDSSGLSNFQLFPNPAVDNIELRFNQSSTYQNAVLTIQNLAGAVLKRYPVIISGKKINVDISSLSEGVYVISLSGDKFIANKKLVKIR